MSHNHRIRLAPWAALGAMLIGAALPAQAQVSYTMTALGKPAGATTAQFYATHIDNQGVVRGGTFYVAKSTFNLASMGWTRWYLGRPVSWGSNNTSGTVPAVLGDKYLLPLVSNDKGGLAGIFTKSSFIPYYDLTPAPNDWPGMWKLGSVDGVTAVRIGGKDSLAASLTFTPSDMNNNGEVVGSNSGYTDWDRRPVLWRAGNLLTLPLPAEATAGMTVSLNDSGTVAGQVFIKVKAPKVVDPDQDGWVLQSHPALWVNDQIAWVSQQPELNGSRVVKINSQGQVLATGSPPNAYLIQNGQATTITGPQGAGYLRPADLNDSGSVVGCYGGLNDSVDAPTRGFIWRNGQAVDLQTELTAKGVKLPAGTQLACPWSINNKGSMLAYYFKTATPTAVTWVRIDPKP